ncbi:unknown [Prevotella sp. CAG:1124]|nr:unknown [Prevotella sp. CAG:1124]
MCLPSYFHDEADCHTGVLVSAAESVDNIQFLAGKFLLCYLLNSSPSLL